MKARIFSLAGLLLLAPACGGGHAEPPATASATAPAASVASVVFLGQEEACDCTRKRIDDSWAVLDAALKDRGIPYERMQTDIDTTATELWRAKRTWMVAPAVFFVGTDGEIVELLQGEITAEQVEALLGDR